ncbi:MAG: YtxH domain-containing protein [Geobacteraceae bacterium]|nr:YtxH domain-containing protein [Geobacteraceae bacterium]
MSGEDRGSSLATVVVSFLAGAAIGSGLALLFAPKTGREVREQIRDMTEDAVDKIKEYAREAQDRIKSTYECGKEAVMEKKSIISSAIEAGKEAMEKEKERLSEQHKA